VYSQIDQTTTRLVTGLRQQILRAGQAFTINQVGSMFTLFFTPEAVTNFDSAKTSDTQQFARYFQAMLQKGIYLAPSQYEAMFISAAMTDTIADQILEANQEALSAI
jgi:glutamate-1-semialdehyde 2,1-aminomutase